MGRSFLHGLDKVFRSVSSPKVLGIPIVQLTMMNVICQSIKMEIVDVVDLEMWEFQDVCELVRYRLTKFLVAWWVTSHE